MRKDNDGFMWDADKFFVLETAKLAYMDNGMPIFKDCRGNFAEMRGRNGHRLKFDSGDAFVEWNENKRNERTV